MQTTARVIADECAVVGMTYNVHVDTTIDARVERGSTSLSEQIGLTVDGGEAAIPWAAVLVSGRDEL